MLTSHISLLDGATQARIAGATARFMRLGQADPDLAGHQAMVALGGAVHHQASELAFSDTIILQSALLGIAFVAVLFIQKAAAPSGSAEAH